MFYYFSIFNIFILVFIKKYDAQFTLSRTPGSKPLHLRIQLPPTSSDSISFIALFPNENCLTNNLIDNRIFLDFHGCRVSLDWSETLFGTTNYFKSLRRQKRRWRVGPVQKLKMGSAIAHYGNDMHIDMDSTGLTASSIAPNGIQVGPRQHKKFKCLLGISATRILEFDLFIPQGTAKCSSLSIQFGPDYKLLGTEERGEKKINELDETAIAD
uniref:Uncharacterized protein n=1 Tax=Meloidogyne enterolobii TaxID=390850 RepID=A0A6V7Y9Q7_MELEN|nr:unnamed protein product [Meloidogyne enterolobii]